MPSLRHHRSPQNPVILNGRLTIEEVWQVKKEVLAAILAHPRVTVRLEEVEEVDLSVLQMLCAARKLARDRDRELRLEGRHLPAVLAAIERYGFKDLRVCRAQCGSCLWV